MRRYVLGLSAVCLALAGATVAHARPASVTLDNAKPTLTAGDAGWTASVGLTNLTDGVMRVAVTSASPSTGARCEVGFGEDRTPTTELAAASHESVDVSYSAGCPVGKTGVAFTLDPEGDARPLDGFQLTATTTTSGKVDWGVFWWFVWSGLFGLVLLAAAALRSSCKFSDTLPSLPSTWSFKDSWVTNITVLGGTLTGVIGTSDTVKAVLGAQADTALAQATIGAAVAAAIIGLGAVIVQTTKQGDEYTVWGLVVAGAVTLSAAFGELYIVYESGQRLALGGAQDHLTVPALLVAALLAAYAYRNLKGTVEAGAKPADTKVVVPDTAIVAAVVAGALDRNTPVDAKTLIGEIKQQLEEVAKAQDAAAEQRDGRAAEVVTVVPTSPVRGFIGFSQASDRAALL